MGDLEYLLKEAEHHFRLAVQAGSEGRPEEARVKLLKAAENLMLAAGQSPQGLKESRKRLALQLMAEADAIKIPLRSVPGAPRAAAQPVGGDDTQAAEWLVQERPNVTFADIAGLEEVKEQIRLRLLYPFTHPETAATYGIQPGGGILLYGPPGTGKTMIARAVAGEVQAAFFAIKPSEIMSQWVGVAEQNIARLFAEADRYPVSVVFVDEMESLTPKRRNSGSTVMQRVVPQILAEMDGFEKRRNPLLLIGATNEPWSIDSAILRPGRLDRLVYVPPPDAAARRIILELNLKGAPLGGDVNLEQVAERSRNFSGADMAALARRVRERVFFEAVHNGSSRPMEAADFEVVLSEMRPSIPPEDLKLFENFAAGNYRGK